MTKDEVWKKIKGDDTKIYGFSMLDVFLQTTEKITAKHFFELSKDQINKLNDQALKYLLNYWQQPKVLEILFNDRKDFSGEVVKTILKSSVEDLFKNAIRLGSKNLDKMRDKDKLFILDTALQINPEFFDISKIEPQLNVFLKFISVFGDEFLRNLLKSKDLLYFVSDQVHSIKLLKKIIEIIGTEIFVKEFLQDLAFLRDRANSKMQDRPAYFRLLDEDELENTKDYRNYFDYRNYLFNFVVLNGIKLNLLIDHDIYTILVAGLDNSQINKAIKILGQENIDKLQDTYILSLFHYTHTKDLLKLAKSLGKKNINKIMSTDFEKFLEKEHVSTRINRINSQAERYETFLIIVRDFYDYKTDFMKKMIKEEHLD